MDLSGHHRLKPGAVRPDRGSQQLGPHTLETSGRALLVAGWTALASAGTETLEVYLRSGHRIAQILDLRVEGDIGHASTRRGHWTHAFPVSDVTMVRMIPRGEGAGRS